MNKIIVTSLSALAALALLGGCGSDSDSASSTSKPLNLKIVHVNDTHSHLDSETMSLKFNDVATDVEIGGYPRVVSKIKSLQNSGGNVLTLNAGDTFQGTLYYSLFKGKADADMLNLIQWDAFELGNHEFDDGDAALKTFLTDFTTAPIVAANVVPQAGNILEGMWEPYVIKEYEGQKVGIVGIDIKQKTEVSSNPSDQITFLDELTTAQKYIDELKAQGINKIVLLSHIGYDKDLDIASKLSGVDIIIGGDSHTLLGDFSAIGTTTVGAYPTQTTNADGEKVCIGQAWQYAYAVGAMDVAFDEQGVVATCNGNATLLLGDSFKQKDASGTKVAVSAEVKAQIMGVIDAQGNLEVVAKDATAEEKLGTYRSQVDAQKSVVIGSSSERLGHVRIPETSDTAGLMPLGSDIAPIVAKSFYDLSNRAHACIQNAGGVRVPVEEGNITMGTAYALLPFANTLFEIDMKGSEVKQVLEDALANYLDNGGSTGSFPYAYGLRYDIDTTKASGSRIGNLEIKDRTSGAWSAINPASMYVIVTNNYIASGKDGYLSFKTAQENNGAGVDTYLDYAMSFVRYMENLTKEGKSLSKLPAADHPIKSYNAALLKVGSYATNTEAASEITAYDKTTKRLFVTNGAANRIDVLDIATPAAPKLHASLDMSSYGTGINSVAVKNGVVAVASENKVDGKHQKGSVVLFDANGNFSKQVTVGFLPDMVTFNEEGTKVVVANEGEPNGAYDYDPEGSIGIVTVADGSYVEAGFAGATLTPAADGTPVRLGGTPSNDQAKDIEPEYIAVSGNYAYVTLQENNALAKVNLTTGALEFVHSFGAKSHDTNTTTIDIVENGKIEMKQYAGLYGLYMPDTIAAFSANGATYLATANEGDGREYCLDSECDNVAFADEKKISKLTLDPSIAAIYEDEDDLKVMIDMGDSDKDGDYEKLYTYGARSFSIWNTNGTLVFDSGDTLEKLIAQYEPALFNQDEGDMDGRSGNKGGEPEALAIGSSNGKTYAFVGLERQSAIVVFDVTEPANATFVDYVMLEKEGDISPEGLFFIPAADAPNGKNLLVVSSEVSGSTSIYEFTK
ncbi:MAG: NAD nucleotidase [Campylobacterales bacterium]|nr:NAD nucleotidase [Campylobacterales bacterium]